MTLIRNCIVLGLFIPLLSGCLASSKFFHEPAVVDRYNESSVLQELQVFLGDFAQKTSKERSALCASIFQKGSEPDNLLQPLKLSYAIAITPGCGSTSEALTLLEASRKLMHDEELINVVDYQLLLLKRLHGVSRYALSLKSKTTEFQEKATILELKLEAIKSIEKALNRRE